MEFRTRTRDSAARADQISLSLSRLPIGAVVAGFALGVFETLSKQDRTNDYVIAGISAGGWLIYPALLAEVVVLERETSLRSVLAVMGCDSRAYWAGTFLGDYVLFAIVAVVYWVVILSSGLTRWLRHGGVFYFLPIFGVQITAYSYLASWLFTSAKRCIAALPGIQILQICLPQMVILIAYAVIRAFDRDFEIDKILGGQYWLTVVLSPQGAFWFGFFNIANNLRISAKYAPRLSKRAAFVTSHENNTVRGSHTSALERNHWRTRPLSVSQTSPRRALRFYIVCIIMALEGVAFLFLAHRIDERTFRPLERVRARGVFYGAMLNL